MKIPNFLQYKHFVVLALIIGYTLITELPIGLIPERQMMTDIAKWYDNIEQKPDTYINHIWFFYAGDFDLYDEQFHVLNKKNLEVAESGSIVIWDTHYGWRLSGDVMPEYFETGYQRIGLGQAGNFTALIMQKE